MFTGKDCQSEKDFSTDSRGSIGIQELVEKTGRRGTIDTKKPVLNSLILKLRVNRNGLVKIKRLVDYYRINQI